MNAHRVKRLLTLAWRVARWRFFKFAVVGASGTVVNLCVLYAGQEWLFSTVVPSRLRLNVSLALAIFVATLNNFCWNRVWTWRDRRVHVRTSLPVQFGQYTLASWLGILLQLWLTNMLVVYFHYLLANALAIAVASLCNFLANGMWTFGGLKLWPRLKEGRALRKRSVP